MDFTLLPDMDLFGMSQQDNLVAQLKTLRHQVLLNTGEKTPSQQVAELSAILANSPELEASHGMLGQEALNLVNTITAKCVIDSECEQKLNEIKGAFTARETAPGNVFDAGAVVSRVPLYQWLIQHRDAPYPTDKEKLDLAKKTGMTVLQINHWFVNSRRRKVAERDDLNMLYAETLVI
ncbi:hypothetical protein CcCBS67573_g10672 [Chytriomyces confervae]|uniref:Homeobox domain-containing protein n=1 Tax=Chytriomyces confervae TaxID=246404 RepID=A0A507CIA7_9FUNG|nr:hypothetical protein CcCBS67573_g10672 [Chytriomyces confervae]